MLQLGGACCHSSCLFPLFSISLWDKNHHQTVQIKFETKRVRLTPSSEFQDNANNGTVNKNNCFHKFKLFDCFSP